MKTKELKRKEALERAAQRWCNHFSRGIWPKDFSPYRSKEEYLNQFRPKNQRVAEGG